ncbi:hypothetical protein J437_LFUL001201 [Ladona fulva]|uniref:FZ domain-containing protein n=1 Tax=Ladona fulva TaxID=123851 RepID=A0A8K0NXF2_LADFU|nr:hypothetical protein J437_LFUL001201 [Ladona fulva]
MGWKREKVTISLALATLLVSLATSAVIPESEETNTLATVSESTTFPVDPQDTSWFETGWSINLGGLFSFDGRFSWWQSAPSTSGVNFTITLSSGAKDSSSSEENVSTEPPRERRCEQLTAPLCIGIGYESTWVPNLLNHTDQMAANEELRKFSPLVKIECSRDLPFFLCNIFVPECGRGNTEPVLPCRSMCERVKSGCDAAMEKLGIVWPDYLSCEKFPDSDDPDKVCTGQ